MEQDPKEILVAVKACIKIVNHKLDMLSMKIDEIVTVGITNQRETTVVWDANTGEPLYNAIGGYRFFHDNNLAMREHYLCPLKKRRLEKSYILGMCC